MATCLTQLFDLEKARLIVINRYEYLYQQASLRFDTASDSQKPVYLSKMVHITDRLVSMLGLEALRVKQENERIVALVENELAKSEALTEVLAKL